MKGVLCLCMLELQQKKLQNSKFRLSSFFLEIGQIKVWWVITISLNLGFTLILNLYMYYLELNLKFILFYYILIIVSFDLLFYYQIICSYSTMQSYCILSEQQLYKKSRSYCPFSLLSNQRETRKHNIFFSFKHYIYLLNIKPRYRQLSFREEPPKKTILTVIFWKRIRFSVQPC